MPLLVSHLVNLSGGRLVSNVSWRYTFKKQLTQSTVTKAQPGHQLTADNFFHQNCCIVGSLYQVPCPGAQVSSGVHPEEVGFDAAGGSSPGAKGQLDLVAWAQAFGAP